MGWNIFKKAEEKKALPVKRRPFIYDTDKIENIIELYSEVSDTIFKYSTVKKK